VTDFTRLLQALAGNDVRFIVVGGVAATVHGSARLTQDLDVVYARDDANLARLVEALSPLSPYLRGAPPGLPFRWDVLTLRAGLNFTLTTSLGDLDLLGEIAGGGSYAELARDAIAVQLDDVEFLCLGLQRLIDVKRAAGRPKDLEAIAELEVIRDEMGG
jgi:predicted nucleotidyltransferase